MKTGKKPLPSKILEHKQALCNQVRRIAIEAGEITLDFFDEAGFDDVSRKDDGSPVTAADEKAEIFITKALKAITPEVPVVGEEAASEGKCPDLSGETYFWCVDPLDGTKEFISGSGDYTVNIALIENDMPVLGVVYAPYHGELYAGWGEGTAIRWMEDNDTEKSIRTRKAPSEGITVVASKSHGSGEKLDNFLAGYKVKKLMKRGSSLKICSIAAGKADVYPRFGPTCEWDTAAADAVLRSAGGIMTDTNNKPLTYRKTESKFLNPEFLAWSGDLYPLELGNDAAE